MHPTNDIPQATGVRLFLQRALVFLAIVLVFRPVLCAQDHQAVSGFLFNFAKFTHWDSGSFESPDSPYIFAVFRSPELAQVLNVSLQSKSINGRRCMVRHFSSASPPAHCHILYIPQKEHSSAGQLLSACRSKAVLSVAYNIDNFCQRGGIINLTQGAAGIEFEINNQIALRKKLVISAKLLSLAKHVVK